MNSSAGRLSSSADEIDRHLGIGLDDRLGPEGGDCRYHRGEERRGGRCGITLTSHACYQIVEPVVAILRFLLTVQ